MSAGFPHITITHERKHLAYECCLHREVITKRVAALDDITRRLQSVKVMGNTALDVLAKWPILKTKFFPEATTEQVYAVTLVPRILYINDDNAVNHAARVYFDQYIAELSARNGMVKFVIIFFIMFRHTVKPHI
jgi:hypothetical protein